MDDPRNLDAWVQLAFLAPDLGKSTQVLLNAEVQGQSSRQGYVLVFAHCIVVVAGREFIKKDLGPTTFDDGNKYMGMFWSLMETRPYMRVLQALIRIHQENKRFDKAA